MIPSLFDITLPLLKSLSDGKPIHTKNLVDKLALSFGLTAAERSETTPGGVNRFSNRVIWACVELKGARLINKKNGMVSITDKGQKLLGRNPKKIDRKFLMDNCAEYREWKSQSAESRKEKRDRQESKSSLSMIDVQESKSPMDVMDEQYEVIRAGVKTELLERISDKDPGFFEDMTLKLVRAMGYGISYEVLGRTHDGGIDGVITEDKLKFDQIYFQAKRWKGVVPISQVRDFVGALASKKSDRGIFITSSNFTNDAYKYVETISQKVVLIDGDELTNLMYDNNIGVSVGSRYEIKQVDEEFFD